jgi:SOS-response transcriptional repressor LexA
VTAAAPFGLTPGQSRALSFIRSHIAQRRCAPSLDQIAAACGLASKSGAHRLVSALEERGHIRRLANRARTITLSEPAPMSCSLSVSIALHARVAAEAHRLG